MVDTSALRFEHDRPIPLKAFALLLAVLCTRRIVDEVAESGHVRTILKRRSRTLWDGSLHPTINMTLIEALLQVTVFPLLLGPSIRFIHPANRCCNVTVERLKSKTIADFVMLQLVEEVSGGVGAKESQRMCIRNSLAATLLEQGYTMEWVTDATETWTMPTQIDDG